MDREQITKWAYEAANGRDSARILGCAWLDLHRFAMLVRNAALEEAKEACNTIARERNDGAIVSANAGHGEGVSSYEAMCKASEDCADAIDALIRPRYKGA